MPILSRDDDLNIEVNLNPYISETIRETEAMWRLGLAVPDEAQVVAFCKQRIFENLERITDLAKRYNQVR